MGLNIDMRYQDIIEAAPDAHANARNTQSEKLAAANDKVAKASQTYQSTVRAAHDSAAAAKRKLSAPPKPPAPPKPIISAGIQSLRSLPAVG
jgi:hypothetical protein